MVYNIYIFIISTFLILIITIFLNVVQFDVTIKNCFIFNQLYFYTTLYTALKLLLCRSIWIMSVQCFIKIIIQNKIITIQIIIIKMMIYSKYKFIRNNLFQNKYLYCFNNPFCTAWGVINKLCHNHCSIIQYSYV